MLVAFDVLAQTNGDGTAQLFNRLGTASLAGLVIAEVIRFTYGRRHEELSNREIEELRNGIEQERLERVKIGRAAPSRSLPDVVMTRMAERLKEFRGTKVAIETFPEQEPRNIALHILVTLADADWVVPPDIIDRADTETPAYLVDFESAGVWLELGIPYGDPAVPIERQTTLYNVPSKRLDAAVDALMEELNNNGIVARRRSTLTRLPNATIRIVVARKPAQGESGAEYGEPRSGEAKE
jgi:hypothetical protein